MNNDDTRHSSDFIVNHAEEILYKYLGEKARLRPANSFAESPAKRASIVIRCQVTEGPSELPSTVIAKKVREHGSKEGPYLPDSPCNPNNAHGFFTDWSSLALFNQIGTDLSLLPFFYGGDREAGVIVMEDLGDGHGLDVVDAVEGSDPGLAEEALVEYAQATGQLHAVTVGKAESYYRIRYSLGPRPEPFPLYTAPWVDARGYSSGADEVVEAIQKYQVQFKHVGIQPHPNVGEEIESVTAHVGDCPSPFWVLCQGDQNGVGGFIRYGSRLRMYDFDAGGFRHALLEGVPARITWGGMVRVPRHVVVRMDKAYQTAFAKGCPEAADDASFYRAMVEAGGYWHVFHIITRLPGRLESDSLRGPSTYRQQIMGWLEGFADMSEEFGHLPALGKSARDMLTRLRSLWPSTVHYPPYYSAFRGMEK